jgi:hypothetical protein
VEIECSEDRHMTSYAGSGKDTRGLAGGGAVQGL